MGDVSTDIENMLEQDLERGEGRTVEFKSQFPTNARQLAEIIASFATSDGGRIYLGINDNGTIYGLDEFYDIDDPKERDSIQRRIQGIVQKVEPRIRVKVEFLRKNGKGIVAIIVPKGIEPIYYVGNIPYVRDLSSSRRATPEEVKELHLKYFQQRGFLEQPNEKQKFLFDLLMQISDIQLALKDPEDHSVDPFLQQLQYDLGATARILSDLSLKPISSELGITDELRNLSSLLEDMASYRFYLGKESWNGFFKLRKECLKIANRLYSRMKKHYNISGKSISDFRKMCRKNIETLKNEWSKAEKYLERGEIDRLKEEFRRLGYTFHRLGSIPEAEECNVELELREMGERLRALSSMKYFLPYIGYNPIEKMKPEIEYVLKLSQEILNKIGA